MTPSAVTHRLLVFSAHKRCRETNEKVISQSMFALSPLPNDACNVKVLRKVLRRLSVVAAITVRRFLSLVLTEENWAFALDVLFRIHIRHVRACASGGGPSKIRWGWSNDERALRLARINSGSQSGVLA